MENSNREKTIIKTSIISILANIVLAIFKSFVGFLSGSIAIILDAVNNLSDALSSIITLVGIKLSSKAPDKNHPYGYGRIEYITSFIVSAIVLYAGITSLVESIKKTISPETVNYNYITIIILVFAIIVKFTLGMYVKNIGKKVNSSSLVASGHDAFNDAIISISVLASAIIYIFLHVNLESYLGIIISTIIVKSGIELIKESVDNIIGTRIQSSLSKSIKSTIKDEEKDVYGVFDVILNDYGPDNYLGSLHIEVLDTLSMSEIDKISRRITKSIKNKFGVILHTIGIYSINTSDAEIIQAKKTIEEIVFSHPGILQMHGFYLDKIDKQISFDIIIDFKIKDRNELFEHIYKDIEDKFPEYSVNITLDVDISD